MRSNQHIDYGSHDPIYLLQHLAMCWQARAGAGILLWTSCPNFFLFSNPPKISEGSGYVGRGAHRTHRADSHHRLSLSERSSFPLWERAVKAYRRLTRHAIYPGSPEQAYRESTGKQPITGIWHLEWTGKGHKIT
eukprot:scaffold18895_cov30-Tisochrysis_lutea.AAC.3